MKPFRIKMKMKMTMPQFVEKSAFLRQTWALLKRNAVLHVYPPLSIEFETN